MILIGLTGSIASGKSTLAKHLEAKGIPVLNADSVTHSLYENEAVALIGDRLPQAVVDGKIDRKALRRAVEEDPSLFAFLESVVHPLVFDKEMQFRKRCLDEGRRFAVIDSPLMLEAGHGGPMDVVLLASAPENVRKERFFERETAREDLWQRITARQWSDEKKRRLAHFVIPTDCPLEVSLGRLEQIVMALGYMQ